MIEFQKYPKTARLMRDCVITEKIDGTNSGIQVVALGDLLPGDGIFMTQDSALAWAKREHPDLAFVTVDDVHYALAAQSRNRLITPGKSTDNHGFAGWAYENAATLVRTLGPGIHFGEWWGQGIQRRYGMDRKVFSLFNVARWGYLATESPLPELSVVPVLYEGPFSTTLVSLTLSRLIEDGSLAAPGFMDPEGVIVFHKASRTVFKQTIHGDEEPKGVNR